MFFRFLAFFGLLLISFCNPATSFGATISGTLAFDGAPASEGFVNIWDEDGLHVERVWTPGDGTWMRPDLPSGVYYLTARGENFGMVSELYDNFACPWEACDVTQGNPITLTDTDITGIVFDLAPEERLWRLHGTVRDAGGQPVGGAVRLYNVRGWHMYEMWLDHEGNFESDVLADGSYYAATVFTNGVLDEAWDDVPCVNQLCDLTADASPIIVDGGDVDGLDIVLEPITSGGHIGGQVRGPDGPLANVHIEIRNVNGDNLFGLHTDPDGYYETGEVADDTYFVVAQNEQLGLGREVWDDVACEPLWLCGDPGFIRDHGTPIGISGGDRLDIDFDLVIPPGGMISGQLIDADTGLPVMGAWMVLINADNGNSLWGIGANGNGEYYFSGLEAGEYKILAEGPPEGYIPELYGGDHCPWECDPGGLGDVISIENETTVVSGADIHLDFEGTRIVGRITRSDSGEPVDGSQGWVGVDLFNANGDHMGGWGANEAGLYDIRLEESGDYYLLAVNDPEQHHLVNEVWENIPCIDNCYPPEVEGAALVTVAEGSTFLANFELDPGLRISGSLSFGGDPTGESFVNIWDEDGHHVAWAGNQGDGSWVSPYLPPGTYYATAWGEDFGLVSELYDDLACPWEACDVTQGHPIILTDTDVSGIDFDLMPEQRSWRLYGSIRGPAGQLIGGAVRLYNAHGWHMYEMWPDHLGNFESDLLADGTYFAATVFTDGMLDEAWNNVPCINQMCDLTQDATPIIVDGGDVGGLDFVLEPITSGGHIGGQVRGPDGPLANVWMDIRNMNGDHLFGLHTDADGYYQTGLVADDTYFVVAQNEQMGLGRELWDDITCDPFWLCGDPLFIRDHGTGIGISGGDRLDIDFDLAFPPGGVISGQLVDAATGLPVMGGGMRLVNADTGEFLWSARVNGNGEYYFTGLEAGNYKIFTRWLPQGYSREIYGGDHWPCDLSICGAVVSIADETSVVPGTDLYLDFEGTRIVGRITRSDTGEAVSGAQGWIGVDLFSANGDHMGGWGANEAGLYDIPLEGSGQYYLLAANDMEQHHLINEVWQDIPCIDDCYPPFVKDASLVTVNVGDSVVANFELAALVPPVIERRAKIHPTAMIGDNSIIEANVIVHAHANLGTGVHVIKNAEIGAFCEIRNFVQIGKNAMLGSECYVGEGAFIDKGVRVGARVYVGPYARLGKDVRIGDDAVIGTHVELGKSVTVWPGMCIPDHTVIPKDAVVDTNLCD